MLRTALLHDGDAERGVVVVRGSPQHIRISSMTVSSVAVTASIISNIIIHSMIRHIFNDNNNYIMIIIVISIIIQDRQAQYDGETWARSPQAVRGIFLGYLFR